MAHFNVGHPFAFPTQVVLVDDDPDFLAGIGLILDRDQACRRFRSAREALDFVNEAHRFVGFLQRCYTSYRTGPQESDALTHIDINKLHLEVLNAFRFQTCSTVVVDYSMPEMNGLEFLQSLDNPYVRKVLLTGQADMATAVHAFNQQLIDQYIDKHDPQLKQKLNRTLHAFHEQYLHNSFKLLTNPILANNQDGYLVDPGFQDWFAGLRESLNTVEYYLLDSPHCGFLLLDRHAHCTCVLVWTEDAIEEHVQQLERLRAPAALLNKVRGRELLPLFDTQATKLSRQHACIKDWSAHYAPAEAVGEGSNYHVVRGDLSLLPDIRDEKIYSYAEFLQANDLSSHARH